MTEGVIEGMPRFSAARQILCVVGDSSHVGIRGLSWRCVVSSFFWQVQQPLESHTVSCGRVFYGSQ